MNDFYAPSEIRFWSEHVEWSIIHLRELEAGTWPSNNVETGYTGGSGKKRGHSSYFETPVCLAAEINARLDRCGEDGKLTIKCLADGWDVLTLAGLMHTDQHRIDVRVKRVVRYCSGRGRKRLPYMEFARRYGIKEYYRRVKR